MFRQPVSREAASVGGAKNFVAVVRNKNRRAVKLERQIFTELGNIFGDSHVREERAVLKQVADATGLRR